MNSIQFYFSQGLKCFISDHGHPHFFFSLCSPVIGALILLKSPQINYQTHRQTKETTTVQLETDKKAK